MMFKEKEFLRVFTPSFDVRFVPLTGKVTLITAKKTNEQVLGLLKGFTDVYVHFPVCENKDALEMVRAERMVLSRWLAENGYPDYRCHDIAPHSQRGLFDAFVFMPVFTFQPGSLLPEAVERWDVCRLDYAWAAAVNSDPVF